MINKKSILHFFSNPIVKQVLFWSIAFFYFLRLSWPYKTNKIMLVEVTFFELLLQMIIAFLIIKIFIPKFLNQNKKVWFFISTIILLCLASFAFSYYFSFRWYEPNEGLSKLDFFYDRVINITQYLNSIPNYSLPTIVLVVFNFYKQQKEIANLLEQKRTTELNLLKHQLNPHFLFNTLNNLYALALKKSDKTPEIIAKLSEILDYILYQCKDRFVSLNKEIDLLENYIALEKVRYGNRVEIIFDKHIKQDQKIAPLILLTFVENAFKHGISQELQKGRIELHIFSAENQIIFKLKNTKPEAINENENNEKMAIGMQNTIKQLNLLYPKAHSLNIKNTERDYALELKIRPNENL